MPTESDFESAAAGLRDVVAALDIFVLPLENRMGAHVLEGGELTDSVYESLKTTRVTALSLGAIVEEYAAECTRRMEEAIAAAEAQEQYEDDLADYNDAKDGSPGPNNRYEADTTEPPPEPPPSPADYIEI